jgi:hypothetical protein
MENMEVSHSPTIGKLFESLSKAQGKIETALKDKKNPFFKSSYADLSSVWEACRAPLSENGLAIIQTVEGTKQDMFLITWLGHASGEWMKSRLPLMVMKQDPQSLGSSITYARRYALSAMVGVCPDEDDDGEKAMNRKDNKISLVEKPQDIEEKMNQFLEKYDEEDHEMIKAYLQKYTSHWKKGIIECISEDYADKTKFLADFSKWRKKEMSKSAA